MRQEAEATATQPLEKEKSNSGTSPLVLIGDKLGLYKALAAHGEVNSTQLAELTNTSERYVREWLAAQAASG